METKVIFVILGATMFALTGNASASTINSHVYYVATTGNDANNGNQAAPWQHLAKATATAVAGDTVYVHGGTYKEQVIFNTSGVAGNPITFSAYPGESPVLNYGKWLQSGPLDGVVMIKGDYVIFEGFEVRDGSSVTIPNYNGQGIKVFGNNDKILYNNVDIVPDTGIWVGGNNNLIQGNAVYDTNLLNTNGAHPAGWGSGIVVRGPQNGTTFASGNMIRSNTVHNNWGEGVYAYYGVTNTTITGNTVYDNWALNIGLSSSYNGVISNNLSYISHSLGAPVPWAAIVVTIDGDTIDPPPNNNVVYNNFVYGGEINVQQLQTSTRTIPIENTFIYFNTVVNPGGYAYIMGGTQTGLIVEDNIFVGAGGNPWYSNVALATNNYWLTSPVFSNGRPSNLSNPTTDVIGNAEASMAKTGSLSAGQLTAAWFYLLSNSPARHAGVFLPAVPTDAFGTSMPQFPDLGARQYGSGPSLGARLNVCEPVL